MEYILLLVISVSLVLSLMNQFVKPFGSFISNYMGDYIGCLLETGEFPTTGNTPNSASECDFKFKPATLAEGRGSNGTNASESAASKAKNNGSNSDGSSGSGSYAGSAGQRTSSFDAPPPSRRNGDGGGGETKIVEISIGTTEEAGFTKGKGGNAYGNSSGSRAGQVIIYGSSVGSQGKPEEDKRGGTRTIASDGPSRSSKKLSLKPSEKDVLLKGEKAEEWNLGDFFRYFMIAVILILLISVIGGQVARLSKSWE